ncbi:MULTISPECIES: hypothetical protein [Vibrio]|uniref:hypothetical protein n=1 Tax=Vibrio TaxID=662 RepID=UPI00078B7D10|nr:MULTISPECIES: hypothetical protein [Vibrio]BAU70973.1 hypothetical protein [Vibrio sp. 04Ya108]BBM67769.1 hypothetical protein VA249_44150 [Vibrio alfacsensis]BCN26940.1 hypothetical protein VYA_41320 [Vibrio alfacsensis]
MQVHLELTAATGAMNVITEQFIVMFRGISKAVECFLGRYGITRYEVAMTPLYMTSSKGLMAIVVIHDEVTVTQSRLQLELNEWYQNLISHRALVRQMLEANESEVLANILPSLNKDFALERAPNQWLYYLFRRCHLMMFDGTIQSPPLVYQPYLSLNTHAVFKRKVSEDEALLVFPEYFPYEEHIIPMIGECQTRNSILKGVLSITMFSNEPFLFEEGN